MFQRHQKGRTVPPVIRQEVTLPEATEPPVQSQSQSQSESLSDVNHSSLETSESAAPKRRGRKPGATNAVAARQTETLNKIRTTLEMLFGTASTLAIATGGVDKDGIPKPLARDGIVIKQGAPNLIEAILVLCQQDKNVRDFFLSLSTGSAYANVVIASLPIVIGILANHNLIPPIFGTPAPVAVAGNGVSGN